MTNKLDIEKEREAFAEYLTHQGVNPTGREFGPMWMAWQGRAQLESKQEWVSVEDSLPAIGQKVILFDNGVVQEDIYELDAHDPSDFHIEYFWARDDIDECPAVKTGQFWQPLPQPPEAKDD